MAASVDQVRVTIVTIVAPRVLDQITAELRKDSIVVELATASVIEHAPGCPVYLICVDIALAGVVADKLVAWAQRSELRPGLLAIVEAGTVRESEALLAAGFDDVVATPLSSRELIARVRALHRRVHWTGIANGRLRHGELTLNLHGRELWVHDKVIPLTSIELAVLRELIKARGRPLSRIELLDLAWGEADLEISERAVDNVILRLRRKLPRADLIETLRGVGFRIVTRAP